MSHENLFLEHQHPVSRRLAILEDDGTSGWLYLSEPDSRKPIGDAWVFNRVAAPSAETIKSFRGGPPPAAEGYASEKALCAEPASHRWAFVWSLDGESVAIAKDGEAVAGLARLFIAKFRRHKRACPLMVSINRDDNIIGRLAIGFNTSNIVMHIQYYRTDR